MANLATRSCVIDASVAIKWFSQVDEDNLEKALKLRELHLSREWELIAPDLLIYEVVNALRYNPSFNQEDTAFALSSLRKMEITLVEPTESVLKRAVEIAYENDVTIYDASYLSLAQERRILFLSADAKFCQKVSGLAQVMFLPHLEL